MRTLAALLLLSLASAMQAQVALVHAGIPDAVDHDQMRNLLLGRVTTWADGSQVVLVLSNDESTRKLVLELTGRDLDRLMRGWKRILFSGNGAMPTVTNSSEAALAEVRQRPGAIAIVAVAPKSVDRLRVVPLSATAAVAPVAPVAPKQQ